MGQASSSGQLHPVSSTNNNSKSVLPDTIVRTPAVPRQHPQCCVCLEPQEIGLTCCFKHYTCDECFSRHVYTMCGENSAKLVENSFAIRCVFPDCKSNPWRNDQLRKHLNDEAFDEYLNTVVSFSLRATHGKDYFIELSKKDRIVKQITESLNMLCPHCNMALDPTPDGCCAMKCSSCATHFCWLCFEVSLNSVKCHDHVRKCERNPSKNLFAPAEILAKAHKQLRILRIKQILITEHSGDDTLWKDTTQTQSILEQLGPLLSQSQITPTDILAEEERKLPAVAEQPLLQPVQPAAQAAAVNRVVGNNTSIGAYRRIIIFQTALIIYIIAYHFYSLPSSSTVDARIKTVEAGVFRDSDNNDVQPSTVTASSTSTVFSVISFIYTMISTLYVILLRIVFHCGSLGLFACAIVDGFSFNPGRGRNSAFGELCFSAAIFCCVSFDWTHLLYYLLFVSIQLAAHVYSFLKFGRVAAERHAAPVFFWNLLGFLFVGLFLDIYVFLYTYCWYVVAALCCGFVYLKYRRWL